MVSWVGAGLWHKHTSFSCVTDKAHRLQAGVGARQTGAASAVAAGRSRHTKGEHVLVKRCLWLQVDAERVLPLARKIAGVGVSPAIQLRRKVESGAGPQSLQQPAGGNRKVRGVFRIEHARGRSDTSSLRGLVAEGGAE